MKNILPIGKNYQIIIKSNFPPEVIPFSNIIKAPENLKKRLSYIGLVKNKENIDDFKVIY